MKYAQYYFGHLFHTYNAFKKKYLITEIEKD